MMNSARVAGKGKFYKLHMKFQEPSVSDGLTSLEQAKEILRCVRKAHKEHGFSKVGIIYSANNEQVEKYIIPAYEEGNTDPQHWKVNISGSGQAAVIKQILTLLEQKENEDLRSVFQILPITKSLHAAGQGATTKQLLLRDINNINDFTCENNLVLAWSNQKCTEHAPYAVGGGNSGLDVFPADLQALVQKQLIIWMNQDGFHESLEEKKASSDTSSIEPSTLNSTSSKSFLFDDSLDEIEENLKKTKSNVPWKTNRKTIDKVGEKYIEFTATVSDKSAATTTSTASSTVTLRFHVYENKMLSKDKDIRTFIAMLEAYKKIYKDMPLPLIKTPYVHEWNNACATVGYKPADIALIVQATKPSTPASTTGKRSTP